MASLVRVTTTVLLLLSTSGVLNFARGAFLPQGDEVAATTSTGTTTNDDSSPTTSVAETCTGDGSFTITADADPTLEGCFKNSGHTMEDDGMVIYSVSGTANESQLVVFAVVSDTGDLLWYIAYISSGNDRIDTRLYCISEESASNVNPANASWNCEFDEDGDTYSLASESDLSIECGSCTTTMTPVDAAQTNAASMLAVGIATAGGAGIVAAASAYGTW